MQPGTRLGPYEIVSRIGAGGMGEVWRARDTRLGRDVAIKTLPVEFQQDAKLKIRFEREAKTISHLNHPNICTLFDVGENYIVMELLEGESLANRLLRGPMPLSDVTRYGAEIAEALNKGHQNGIVHRDVKPGNVMITKSGAKLLDFGLAKSSGIETNPEPDGATVQRSITRQGLIVGTLRYMAPEQLEGLQADARSDIFALGAVLYEMTTGRPAFQGTNTPNLIAALARDDPHPAHDLQPATPPALEHVIRKCLDKDPDRRWQSAADIADELRWISEVGFQAGTAAPLSARGGNREGVAWIAAVVALAATAAMGTWMLRERAKPGLSVHSSVIAPPNTSFRLTADGATSLTVSPDGKLVTFLAASDDGTTRLWVRPVASDQARPLAGTEDSTNPFWSPDSRFIAFFAGGFLQRIDIRGGPPQNICEVGLNPRRGSWNRDGVIVFSPTSLGPIHRVSASGGQSMAVTKLDTARGETTHRWATFLPDGRHFLYFRGSHLARSNTSAVFVGDLDGGSPRLAVRAASNMEYAGGWILYVRGNVLVTQKFDVKEFRTSGDPVPVADGIQYDSEFIHGAFSVSQTGLLVYRKGSGVGEEISLEWRDWEGKVLESIGLPRPYREPSLSPDGKQLAVSVYDEASGTQDIWVIDLGRRTPRRLTFGAGDRREPHWSPDGTRIVYSQLHEGLFQIFENPADRHGAEKLIATSTVHQRPGDWSSDGRTLLVTGLDPRANLGEDMFTVSMAGKHDLRPLIVSPFNEGNPRLSRDGRWYLYTSNESGRNEIYIASLHRPGVKRQVSTASAITGGGSAAAHSTQVMPVKAIRGEWGPGDREILYRLPDGSMMAAAVELGTSSVEISTPRLLFKDPSVSAWTLHPTAKRILVGRSSGENESIPITLVANWPATLPH